MTQLANIPLSISQVYTSSTHLWRVSAFKKVQLLALLTIAWAVFPCFFMPPFNINGIMMWLQNTFVYYGLPFAFYVLGILVLFAAVYSTTEKALVSQNSTYTDGLKTGFKKSIPLIFAVIFSGIVLVLGYTLLIVPGIILQFILFIYYPLIIVDGFGPIAAFKRSFQLVDGYFWRTVFIIGIPLLLLSAVMWGFDTVFYKLVLRYYSDREEFWVLQYIIRMLLAALFFPFFATLMLVHINDLKLRQRLHG